MRPILRQTLYSQGQAETAGIKRSMICTEPVAGSLVFQRRMVNLQLQKEGNKISCKAGEEGFVEKLLRKR